MTSRLGLPDIGAHRPFVSALAIDALGSGIWLPLSLLFFLRTTDVGLVRLGVAMTIANLLVIPVVPLVGRVVDSVGPKTVLQAGNLLQAATFAVFPLVTSQLEIGLVVGVASLGRSMFWGANGPLVTQIAPPGEREIWFGFVQQMRNAGYGVGGLLAGVALGIGTGAAYDAVVWANATSYLLAFALMTRVHAGGRPVAAAPARGSLLLVARDPGYRLLVLGFLLYGLTESTLNVVMPVYTADLLGLAGWVPAAIFVINTLMIGVGQGLAVRSMTGRVRYRVVLSAIGFTAAAFAMMYAAGSLGRVAGTALVLVAAVVYTVGEMTAGPVLGALSAEAAPPEHRGLFMSTGQLGWSVSSAVAPVVYTLLLDHGRLTTWAGPLLLCALWAFVVLRLRTAMPRASTPVTNAAEEPVAV